MSEQLTRIVLVIQHKPLFHLIFSDNHVVAHQ